MLTCLQWSRVGQIAYTIQFLKGLVSSLFKPVISPWTIGFLPAARGIPIADRGGL